MPQSYQTILFPGSAELVEKKSRFLAEVRPVSTEAEAKQFIEEVKKRYYDARHHVWAYQIGLKQEIQRYSDDGEPQGSAGLPVLDVLRGQGLCNVAVVVTRYFGGILLGTGGLVRAYGGAAKAAVADAGIARMQEYSCYLVTTDYPTSGKIQYMAGQEGHIIQEIVYTDQVEFHLLAESAKDRALEAAVSELSLGKAEIRKEKTVFGAWVNGKLVVPDEKNLAIQNE